MALQHLELPGQLAGPGLIPRHGTPETGVIPGQTGIQRKPEHSGRAKADIATATSEHSAPPLTRRPGKPPSTDHDHHATPSYGYGVWGWVELTKAWIAAATCCGEEIMVRCRPGMAIGGGAPIREAASPAAAQVSWGSCAPTITRLGSVAARSLASCALVMLGIPWRSE